MRKLLSSLIVMLMLSGCASNTMQGSGNITIYTRDASSGTREAFEKGADFEGELTKYAVEVSSNEDMAAKVGADKNAIGYTSLSTNFEKNGIKPLKFEGVVASKETVLDGSYGLQRPFSFVTRADGDFDSKEKQQLVEAFLDYLLHSMEGLAIVKRYGGEVDMTKAVPWEELKKNHPIVNQDNSHITLITCGSTSVEKTLKPALEAFVPMAGNFKILMNQTGSSDGYTRVLGNEKDGANKADIGFASRAFKDNEDVSEALASGYYCLDAVVAVVNEDNTQIDNLTQEDIKKIFTGESLDWDEFFNK